MTGRSALPAADRRAHDGEVSARHAGGARLEAIGSDECRSLLVRHHFGRVAVVAVAAVAVDAVAFIGQVHLVRYLNILWVWLLPHQIGFFYGDGRMQRMSARGRWTMALGGLAAMVLLTNPPIFLGHGPEL